jgi:predicted amidophosphoribosyltransferase
MTYKRKEEKFFFFKICKVCDERFTPTSRINVICEKCKKKGNREFKYGKRILRP